MKILNFDYTDAKGKQSKRVLYPTQLPTSYFAGTDMTTLDDEQIVQYTQARDELHKEYLAKIAALDTEFDLKFQYRQFNSDNMKNIVPEEI